MLDQLRLTKRDDLFVSLTTSEWDWMKRDANLDLVTAEGLPTFETARTAFGIALRSGIHFMLKLSNDWHAIQIDIPTIPFANWRPIWVGDCVFPGYAAPARRAAGLK
ncbi:MAG: hypothetical protein KDC87_13255 [Planctomycetes bacterium]|nr:hypothetical protein [Planctomycetota bacterium]MCB9889590.1 hypothetical protein [Planctomycetota bacterium]